MAAMESVATSVAVAAANRIADRTETAETKSEPAAGPSGCAIS